MVLNPRREHAWSHATNGTVPQEERRHDLCPATILVTLHSPKVPTSSTLSTFDMIDEDPRSLPKYNTLSISCSHIT